MLQVLGSVFHYFVAWVSLYVVGPTICVAGLDRIARPIFGIADFRLFVLQALDSVLQVVVSVLHYYVAWVSLCVAGPTICIAVIMLCVSGFQLCF